MNNYRVKYSGVFVKKNESFKVEIPDLGIFTMGQNITEAMDNAQFYIEEECVRLLSSGEPLPKETPKEEIRLCHWTKEGKDIMVIPLVVSFEWTEEDQSLQLAEAAKALKKETKEAVLKLLSYVKLRKNHMIERFLRKRADRKERKEYNRIFKEGLKGVKKEIAEAKKENRY